MTSKLLMSEHHKNDLEAFAVEVSESEVKGSASIDKAKLFLPVSILIAAVMINVSLLYLKTGSPNSLPS